MSEGSATKNDSSKSSFSTVIAVLGWIVAALSLTMNFLEYQNKQAERQALLDATPKYSWNFAPLTLNSFPPEIREIKKPVRQAFSIKHESGEPVRGLTILFRAAGGRIVDLVVEEGGRGTKYELQKEGRELVLEKAVLVPEETVSGHLITDGLVEVGAKVGAEKGQEYKRLVAPIGSRPWYLSEEFMVVGILFATVIAACFALYKFAPSVIARTTSPVEISDGAKVTWVIVIGLLTLFGGKLGIPNPTQLFYAVLLYLLVTNLGRLTALLRPEPAAAKPTASPETPKEPYSDIRIPLS